MSLKLDKLLSSSTNNFWASGLVFVMVLRHLAFMINGEPISGTLLLLYSDVVVQALFWILHVKLCWTGPWHPVLIITARFYLSDLLLHLIQQQ
jgi:hypothetical protein